jgi:hypothetical protein
MLVIPAPDQTEGKLRRESRGVPMAYLNTLSARPLGISASPAGGK